LNSKGKIYKHCTFLSHNEGCVPGTSESIKRTKSVSSG
jgi:hypothetical protein